MAVQLDLINPVFQQQWFALEKDYRVAVLNCCGMLTGQEWEAVYGDKGLRWELIQSRPGPGGERLYSIRISQKIRAVARRSGEFLEFLTLYADHDSAYR